MLPMWQVYQSDWIIHLWAVTNEVLTYCYLVEIQIQIIFLRYISVDIYYFFTIGKSIKWFFFPPGLQLPKWLMTLHAFVTRQLTSLKHSSSRQQRNIINESNKKTKQKLTIDFSRLQHSFFSKDIQHWII